MKLTLESCRRLTGPSLYFQNPGTVLDVFVSGVRLEDVVACWQEEVNKLREAVSWKLSPLHVRKTHPQGASLAFNASMDVVYSATELNEAAWNNSVARLYGEVPEDFDGIVSQLKAQIEQESNPVLLGLNEAAIKMAFNCFLMTKPLHLALELAHKAGL